MTDPQAIAARSLAMRPKPQAIRRTDMVEVTQADTCLHCGGRLEGRVDPSEKVHPYRVVCIQCGVGSAWHGDLRNAWSSILARAALAAIGERA